MEGTEDAAQTLDEELRSLLLPDPRDLPPIPPSSVESNFARYFAPGTPKPQQNSIW